MLRLSKRFSFYLFYPSSSRAWITARYAWFQHWCLCKYSHCTIDSLSLSLSLQVFIFVFIYKWPSNTLVDFWFYISLESSTLWFFFRLHARVTLIVKKYIYFFYQLSSSTETVFRCLFFHFYRTFNDSIQKITISVKIKMKTKFSKVYLSSFSCQSGESAKPGGGSTGRCRRHGGG